MLYSLEMVRSEFLERNRTIWAEEMPTTGPQQRNNLNEINSSVSIWTLIACPYQNSQAFWKILEF